jgi:hypothetical protein
LLESEDVCSGVSSRVDHGLVAAKLNKVKVRQATLLKSHYKVSKYYILTRTCVAPCSSPMIESKVSDPNRIAYTAPDDRKTSGSMK